MVNMRYLTTEQDTKRYSNTSDVVTKEKSIPELRRLHHEVHIFVGGKGKGGSYPMFNINKTKICRIYQYRLDFLKCTLSNVIG